MHEKVFIVSIYTDSKSDMGIEVMEQVLNTTIASFNALRKCYYAHKTELTGKMKQEVEDILKKKMVNDLDKNLFRSEENV